MRISRTDRSRLADWWFTVDWMLAGAIAVLFAVGLVVVLAASPAVAESKGLPAFHFVERHVMFAAVGALTVLTISLMEPSRLRALAIAILAICLAAMIFVLIAGPELNGARRWLRLAGLSIQPSEFAKPAFVVVCAVLLSGYLERRTAGWIVVLVAVYAAFALILRQQPDMGQLLLITAVWAGMLVIGGLPLIWPAAMAGLGAVLLAGAYVTDDYIARRIDAFLDGDITGGGQVARAMRSFVEGGFFGLGPGAGTIKTDLPDAHTDFIFAVIAEEYGVVTCLAIACLFAFIVVRLMMRAASDRDDWVRLSLSGLALLIAGQAIINMGVNVGLLPAKGMTLPLISYGGSSMIAVSLTLGMALSLGRRRPGHSRLADGRYVPKPVPAADFASGDVSRRDARRGETEAER